MAVLRTEFYITMAGTMFRYDNMRYLEEILKHRDIKPVKARQCLVDVVHEPSMSSAPFTMLFRGPNAIVLGVFFISTP